jgi:hypothetical protein
MTERLTQDELEIVCTSLIGKIAQLRHYGQDDMADTFRDVLAKFASQLPERDQWLAMHVSA